MENKVSLLTVFDIFQDRERFFELIDNKENRSRILLYQVLVIISLALFYGIVMGSYNSFLQAIVSGLKIPSLLMFALFICFPAFYVIQYMLGSKMTISQMVSTILAGFVVFTTIMASFAPIIIFFMITGNNYAFLKLLHVGIFSFSGFFGMRTIMEALKFSCDKKNVYPKIGITVFKIWIVIFAFVGMQLAWNLRPFIGDKTMKFELFREREGNFYLAVLQSTGTLFGWADKSDREEEADKRPKDSFSDQEAPAKSDTLK
ncbi:MAG: hypothetical protein K9H64_08250 [Bacteroidales bacterium]|nr:hypothetical protein [Bacteroidales bacterium]MCF8455822.1 hypothetical protein [Bacteroidales bacterium]